MLHSSSELRFKLLSFQLCPPFAMAEQDPLVLLRAAITSDEPPKLLTGAQEATESFNDAASLSFTSASVTLAKDTPTRYTAKANSTTGFYNVGQLYLAWLERQAPLREYMMKAQGSGVGYVTTLDRRGVVEYLTGVSDGAGRVIDVGAAGRSMRAGNVG
jgi:parafibromin